MLDRKLRRGDVITVRAKVSHEMLDLNEVYVHAVVGDRRIMLETSDVVDFLYPAIDEGDTVRSRHDPTQVGKVLAVVESGPERYAVVECKPGDVVSWRATALDVVEQQQVEPAPPPPAKND